MYPAGELRCPTTALVFGNVVNKAIYGNSKHDA